MRGRLGSELQKIAVLGGCPYLRAFRHSSAGACSVRELNKGTDVYPLDNDGGETKFYAYQVIYNESFARLGG